MEHQKPTNRRQVLKSLGLLSGVALAPMSGMLKANGVSSTNRFSRTASGTLRVGVLLPDSSLSHAPSDNFLAGMETALRSSAQTDLRRIKLMTERTGTGISKGIAQSRVLVSDGADIITGLIPSAAIPAIGEITRGAGSLLIAASAGERLSDQHGVSPNVFHHSLGLWESNYAMGVWAAQNLGSRGMIAASQYESGYDTLFAFRAGFESTGGSVVATSVTGGTPFECDTHSAIAEIKAAHPDFVYAMFSGKAAVDFVAAYSASGLSGSIPLAGSAFLVDENLLTAHGTHALGIKSAFGWSPELAGETNETFKMAFRAQHRREADAFAVLGYDTAQIISRAVAAAGKNAGNSILAEAIRTTQFESARGGVGIHSQSQSLQAPLYLREVSRAGLGTANTIVENLPVAEHLMRGRSIHSGLRSGFSHSYLCV